MSPLDDELRAALHGRAAVLAPSPDPLAGIERRARRMRRNRVAASVAGSALAVAAIATVVPALQSARSTPPPQGVASAAPTQVVTASPYALDPAQPWRYRGDPSVLGGGNLETFTREWAVRRGVDAADVTFTPLYGELYEPSQEASVVYVAVVDGTAWWGVAQSSEAGPEFPVDTRLAPGTTALAAALPGDEVARLLVVASPEVGAIEYGNDAASEWVPMESLAVGVAIGPLEGDPATDQVRVLAPDGTEVFRGPAPDQAGTPPVTDVARPANALEWPRRGGDDPALLARAVQGYARGVDAAVAEVGYDVLFLGGNDGGQEYVVLQAWTDGQPAQSFGWIESPGQDPQPVLQPALVEGEQVVAILLTEVPGLSSDELVVVPAPGTGQVMYGGYDDLSPAPMPDGLDGVALVERPYDAQDDVVQLLDGDGRPMASPAEAGGGPDGQIPVQNLLCGVTSCS